MRRQATEAAQIRSGEQVVILRSRVYLSTCKDDRGSWRLGSVGDGDPLWRRLQGRQSRTGCHRITTDALLVVLFFLSCVCIMCKFILEVFFSSIFVSWLHKIAFIYTVNENKLFIHSYYHAVGTLLLIQCEYITASSNWNNINSFPWTPFLK